jgi:hypothetical protein
MNWRSNINLKTNLAGARSLAHTSSVVHFWLEARWEFGSDAEGGLGQTLLAAVSCGSVFMDRTRTLGTGQSSW